MTRPLLACGLSIATAGANLFASSSVALAATRPTFNLDLAITSPIGEGSFAVITGTFNDPDLGDQHVIEVNWGDGDVPTTHPLSPVGVRSFEVSKQFFNNSVLVEYQVTVSLSDGLFTVFKFLRLAVQNVAPTITSFSLSASEVSANQPVTANVKFEDPGGVDRHTVTIDWGDGTAATPVTLPLRSREFTTPEHRFTAGGPHTVKATVADGDLGSAEATATIVVNAANQPPSNLVVQMGSVAEGGTAALHVGFADGDTADTHTVDITWGDGQSASGIPLAAGVLSYDGRHVYADTGLFALTVKVTDSAGQSVSGGASVSPTNVGPTLAAPVLSASTLLDHDTLVVSGSFTDPGTADTFTVTVEWGDSTAATQSLGARVRDYSASNQYTTPGQFVVKVTVTDRDGATDSKTANLVVNPRNHAPVGLSLAAPLALEGETATLSGAFADEDLADTHTVTIKWGDVPDPAGLTLGAGVTTFSATHVYQRAGTYSVDASVADAAASTRAGIDILVRAKTAAELLDDLAALVRSFGLDRNIERMILKRIEDLSASLAQGSGDVCRDLGMLQKAPPILHRWLSSEDLASFNALVTKLDATLGCSALNPSTRGSGPPGSKAKPVKVDREDWSWHGGRRTRFI
ncbi:MAG TPA: PKD domain-containing protein [Candidatus Limnocylindria bacterium]|nr:PKD domain-containing protein [Candidatus Limnocylindria bacterium]